MGASTGNMLVDDQTTLEGIFAATDLLVATHCENTPMILQAEAEAANTWGEDIPFSEHPNIRSADACYASSSLAVGLAKKYGTKLHVLHLTTAKEMELFEVGPLEQKRITAEACVHHLFFSADDYAERGAFIKCNPAIKTSADRACLAQGSRRRSHRRNCYRPCASYSGREGPKIRRRASRTAISSACVGVAYGTSGRRQPYP
jgi:dihydroorotase